MRLGTLVLAAAALVGPCSVAFGSSYSAIVSFGDSLSDPGNVSIATLGAYPGPGYATRNVPLVPFPVGYYTNPQSGSGPSGLWIDQLAAKLGVADPSPSFAPLGGTNFSFASSYSAGFNGAVPGMDTQVGLFLQAVAGQAPSSDLYTFWGGANDIFNGLSPVAAADNIAKEIKTVAGAGGTQFLWLNLPPLGETPSLNGDPTLSLEGNLASAAFDSEWASDLKGLDLSGLDVIGVDVNSLFNTIAANPGMFNFTDITHACNVTAGCNPNSFLYWDDVHPTTEADSLVANLAYQDLAATPEPPSATLLALGVCGLGLVYTRRRQISQPA